MNTFQNALSKRRSIYALNNISELSTDEITHMIQNCLYHAPSAFNSQSTRLIILYGHYYTDFWQMVEDNLQKIVSPDKFQTTKDRITSFKQGIGTVLFFEDENIVQNLQKKMPLYADNFPTWATQSNAMIQYMVWATLADKNIGASLQHYNPLIDEDTRRMFHLPSSWRLIAQMPFGGIAERAAEKSHEPLEKRIKVFTD